MAKWTKRSRAAAALVAALVGWGGGENVARAAETQNGDLTVWADYACLRVGDDPALAEVEFSFALQRQELTFVPEPGGQLIAEVGLWVQMLNAQDLPVTDTIAGHFGCIMDSAEIGRPFILSYAMPVQLPPGSYHAKILAMDMYGAAGERKFGELILPTRVRDFSSSGLMLSDLKLAYDIDVLDEPPSAARPDVLVRNLRKVYPDPRGILARDRAQLYFYGEIYNLQYEPGGENVYDLGFRFLTADSMTVKDFGTRAYKKPGTSSVLATGLETRDLPEGSFLLEVAVSDPATGSRAVATKPFSVVRVVEAPADSMTPEQAQLMRNVILYIAKGEDLATYDGLSLAGKRNFLREFWNRLDPTPETPLINERKEEHFRRFNYATRAFSITFGAEGNGWKADRGRIYIIYGQPDQVERYPSSLSEKPAEEWYYFHLGDQGEVYFIFQDETGFGDYKLVHSTARGEKRDPNWERKVRESRLMH